MKKGKVVVLANDTTYTYNLRREIIMSLIAKEYEVVILSKVLTKKTELEELGCRLIDIDSNRHGKNVFSDLILLLRYREILKFENPDIVLSYNIKPNIYGGLICRSFHINYFPNITGLGTAVEYPGFMQILTTKLYKMAVAKASCVLFQNMENQQFFVKHKMLNKKISTRLLNGSGVNLEMHSVIPYPEEQNVIRFLFVARIMKEKGIDLYLNAARKIRKKHSNVMFHICGYCDDKKYLQILKQAEQGGYITYHGEQKNMCPFFSMAHCIIHPSYYPEGMSNVLLEAASHARPIITTDRAGCRETVVDGVTGFTMPIKDEEKLIECIEKFIKLSWKQKREMGIAGRIKMEQEFDRQLVVQAYMEEIEKVII